MQKKCNKQYIQMYIGETKRHLHERFGGHRRSIGYGYRMIFT